VNDLAECEIEDLFDASTLSHEINGKTFSRESRPDNSAFYGKSIFASYIAENYKTIDFSNFIPYLKRINDIIINYDKKAGDDN
jgi:hypothetical protein